MPNPKPWTLDDFSGPYEEDTDAAEDILDNMLAHLDYRAEKQVKNALAKIQEFDGLYELAENLQQELEELRGQQS